MARKSIKYRCPNCGRFECPIIYGSQCRTERSLITRLRKCNYCNYEFKTYETPSNNHELVIKIKRLREEAEKLLILANNLKV